ncbi:MAG: ATP-grasp domain-containing protein [Myxococcota bacterium]
MGQNLVILFGSDSSERFVSVATAQNLSEALLNARCWFWAPNDSVYEVSSSDLQAAKNVFKAEFKPAGTPIATHLSEALDLAKANGYEFVLATHGGKSEDGTLQALFEKRGLVFTGSGSKACHLSMDKAGAKKAVAARQIRVAPSTAVTGKDFQNANAAIHQMLHAHSRLVLKPNWEGSSVGVSIVTQDNVNEALASLKSHADRPYLVEAFVEGIELTVGVIDEGGVPRALVPTELRAKNGLADYDGKYLGLGTDEITPAEVPEAIALEAQRMAVAAHDALGLEGYSRTDMIASHEGVVYLETNSLPGLTKASLVPQALAYEGISIHQFIMQQLELARARLNRQL